jgi:predicted RNase H-like HicB family nuclease
MLVYHAAYYHDKSTGWHTAAVLDFPGVLSQGRTLNSARRMIKDALRTMAEWYLEDGKPLPRPNPRVKDKGADVIEPLRLRIRAEAGALS